MAAALPFWTVPVVSAFVLGSYLAAEALRLRGRSFFPVTTVTSLCSRPSEADSPAFGPVALAFGFVCCFAAFDAETARAAIIVACVADSMAGVFGKAAGSHRIPYSPRKTLEGSAAGLVLALPFGLLCLGLGRGAIAAAAASVIESLPFGDLDNLLTPLGVGCLLTALGA